MALSDLLGVSRSNTAPNSRVAQALARQGVSKTPELTRVLNLPRREIDFAQVADASPIYARGPCSQIGCQYCVGGSPRLRPVQSGMLLEAAGLNGGFFNVGVGQGKTLASLLFHDALQARKTALLIPAPMRTQLLQVDVKALGQHFHLPPVYGVADVDSGKPGVYVIAYTELSDTDASGLLDRLRPDLIVADEAQALRHKDAARTRRFLRYMRANPTRFVCMSGTLANRSILDYAHLIDLALGHNSPLPSNYPDLVSWADAIDNEGKEGHTAPGALAALCNDGETLRDGYRRRLIQSPGVLSTLESACSAKLEIRILRPTPPASVIKNLDKLRADWAWDQEEYNDALEISRVSKQLTQGYYYRLVWPGGVPDRQWLACKNAWNGAIRKRLVHSNRAGQDSPALLEAMAERGDWTPPEYFDWIAVRDRVTPGKEAVELDRWLADYAWSWASNLANSHVHSAGRGIVWVDSPIIGAWLSELGIPYFGEGMDLELAQATPQVHPVIACSQRAHGTGKNLQAWAANLVLYPMASGSAWEQTIGRTHRPGQVADPVTVDIVHATPEMEKAFQQAQSDAKFVEQTTGQPQKLNHAIYL